MIRTSTEFDLDGNLVTVEEIDVPDTRPTLECRSDAGEILTPVRIDETQDGYVTHKCVGDVDNWLHVSCQKAPEWNHRCRSVSVLLAGVSTPQQIASKQLEVAGQLVGLVVTMRTQGCPEHDPKTASPVLLDQLLSTLTPERIRELKHAAEAQLGTP